VQIFCSKAGDGRINNRCHSRAVMGKQSAFSRQQSAKSSRYLRDGNG
jgi:hypothetical protein